jgi:arabinan endo-1,5-alpha-L-arabinosidase
MEARSALVLLGLSLPLLGPKASGQVGDVQSVHDPRIIESDGFFYLFSTGNGISLRRSKDLITWQRTGMVFADPPAWAAKEYPRTRYFWAPDVSFFSGVYHLYFAVSRFGKNESRIGLATNTTLDPHDPNYKWLDRGEVFKTHQGDTWNAIDPAVAFDGDNNPWLVMGSFWDGIKIHRLDPDTGLASTKDTTLYSIARRPPPDALEAGYIIRHDDYFYLVVSFDYCCRGVHSTYKTMVGRSKSITGPFSDKDGKSMVEGGGSLLLASHDNVIGPGHSSVLHALDRDWLVHHFYDANSAGRSTLQINPISWDADDWPVIGNPVAASNSTAPSSATATPQSSTR